jgi:hypothetical protein
MRFWFSCSTQHLAIEGSIQLPLQTINRIRYNQKFSIHCHNSLNVGYKGTTRKIVHAFSDGIKHGWIGRSLPHLFHAAGLTEVTCVPHAVRPYCAFAHRLFDGHLAERNKPESSRPMNSRAGGSTSSRPKRLASFTSGSSGSSLAAGNPESSMARWRS